MLRYQYTMLDVNDIKTPNVQFHIALRDGCYLSEAGSGLVRERISLSLSALYSLTVAGAASGFSTALSFLCLPRDDRAH